MSHTGNRKARSAAHLQWSRKLNNKRYKRLWNV